MAAVFEISVATLVSLLVGRGRHRPRAGRARTLVAIEIVVFVSCDLVRSLVRHLPPPAAKIERAPLDDARGPDRRG
jgi:hypothetical protein